VSSSGPEVFEYQRLTDIVELTVRLSAGSRASQIACAPCHEPTSSIRSRKPDYFGLQAESFACTELAGITLSAGPPPRRLRLRVPRATRRCRRRLAPPGRCGSIAGAPRSNRRCRTRLPRRPEPICGSRKEGRGPPFGVRQMAGREGTPLDGSPFSLRQSRLGRVNFGKGFVRTPPTTSGCRGKPAARIRSFPRYLGDRASFEKICEPQTSTALIPRTPRNLPVQACDPETRRVGDQDPGTIGPLAIIRRNSTRGGDRVGTICTPAERNAET